MTEPRALVPQPADLCVVRMRGAAGLGISLGEWLAGDGLGWHDHVFVYLGWLSRSPSDQWLEGPGGPGHYIAQAQPGGAVAINRGRSLADLSAFYGPEALWGTGCWPLGTARRQDICTHAIAALGTPYSVLDYLYLAACRLHVPVPGLQARIEASGHMICSQYADWCYGQSGVHLFTDGRWYGDVMPADIARLIASARGTGEPV